MTQVNYFLFQIIVLLNHVNKIPRVSLSDLYLLKYIYGYKTPALYLTYFLKSTSLLHKPHLPELKTPHVIFHLLSDVHIPTTQDPPSTHYTQHTYY